MGLELYTSKHKIGVVLPVFNAFQDAIEALLHIRTQHIWTPYIVPQWKTDWPLAKAWNIGISETFEDGCDYALVINDDAFVAPTTVDILTAAMDSGRYTLVSGVEKEGNRAVHYSCFMVGRNIFRQVGYFDENFAPIYFEDNDFAWRMNVLGRASAGIPSALFEHKGSQSLKIKREQGRGAQHDSQFQKNEAYYIKKWGGKPGKEQWGVPFNNPRSSPYNVEKNGG